MRSPQDSPCNRDPQHRSYSLRLPRAALPSRITWNSKWSFGYESERSKGYRVLPITSNWLHFFKTHYHRGQISPLDQEATVCLLLFHHHNPDNNVRKNIFHVQTRQSLNFQHNPFCDSMPLLVFVCMSFHRLFYLPQGVTSRAKLPWSSHDGIMRSFRFWRAYVIFMLF